MSPPKPPGHGRLHLRAALAALALMFVVALLADAISADPLRNHLGERLRPPSARHLLGTDNNGRDVLARLTHGARLSLIVGAAAMAVALAVGVPLGAAAGLAGGVADLAIMRLVEAVMCFPALFLIIGVQAGGARGTATLVVALGVLGFPAVARLVRAEVARVARADFVAAARAAGASRVRVLVRHVLPNALPPVLVWTAFGVAGAILAESSLSFIGLGVPEPAPTWGGMLALVRSYPQAWWLAVFPGAALFVALASLTVVAEELGARRGTARAARA